MDTIIIKMLDKLHADHEANKVKALEPLWFDRGTGYTLGTACYQDDPLLYPTLAKLTNPVIGNNFGTLLSALGIELQRVYGAEKFTYGAHLATPGFHIFGPENNGHTGHVHVDEPFTRCSIGGAFIKPFSFTLALALPECGAGMDYWEDYTAADLVESVSRGTLPPHRTVKYKQGYLYVHDGLTPHRIASLGDMKAGEHRITLQGHGATLVDTGELVLYF